MTNKNKKRRRPAPVATERSAPVDARADRRERKEEARKAREAARKRATRKRGGAAARVPLEEAEAQAATEDDRLLAVHEALDELAAADPDAATLVKLRFFAGMTAAEAAEALGLSVRSAHDLWAYARSSLHRKISAD